MSDRKWHWKAAYALDRSPRLCWANLVTWALGWTRLRDTRVDSVCHRDAANNGRCYCGELEGSAL
jgi:hypothetical protein